MAAAATAHEAALFHYLDSFFSFRLLLFSALHQINLILMWNSTNMPVAMRTLIAVLMVSLYLLLREGCERFEPYMMAGKEPRIDESVYNVWMVTE